MFQRYLVPSCLTLSVAPDTPDLAKTVDVAMDVKGNSQASRDLSLSRFTAVTSVDVNSIKYTDGSEWHAPSAGACSVTPDLIIACRFALIMRLEESHAARMRGRFGERSTRVGDGQYA
jgi:hypothetical protein